jgi:deoxyribodipyrimidine photo-lyase
MNTTILWFRRDLRLHHNPALHWACNNAETVLPVYIHAPDEEAPWQPGGASRWWLHESLQQLENDLRTQGLKLHYFSGKSQDVLLKLAQQTGANAIAFNRVYEPGLHERDEHLIHTLANHHIQSRVFDSGLFFTPGNILNNQNLPYRVYTPFSKKIRSELSIRNIEIIPIPDFKKTGTARIESQTLAQLKLNDAITWHSKFHQYWQPGEQQAWRRLNDFIEHALLNYDQQRDIPGIDGTSSLSAHLHFGEITVEQIYATLMPYLASSHGERMRVSAERFLNQLIWREFGHHILWHYPHTATQSMDSRYADNFWHTDETLFQHWTRGKTGIPIIDAGMKQLWETGWMHNRVRMIVASFLTKNLGCHWRDGARWFWDTLIDADLANNSMGWQWVAGCGVDAAPYYRIFNPVTQAKRFDPDMKYIKHWSPVSPGLDSTTPMIDLDASRKHALERYKSFISSGELI